MIATNHNPLPDELIDEIIARHPNRTGDVLGVLEELQQRHPLQYLPAETQATVARKMGVAQSQIFSVVSFYAFFNRQPQGRHTVAVCRGTACHTRGSKALLDALKSEILGGADAAYDTLLEIANYISTDQTQAAAILLALDNRVRFDAPQTLSAAEQEQAQANIGVTGAGLLAAYIAARDA